MRDSSSMNIDVNIDLLVGYVLMNFQMVSAMSVASLLAVFISGKPRYWASSKPVTNASTWKP
jgi:hypothetical protein